MDLNINKNISVWRGDTTPPTEYHFWIKTDGTQLVQVDDQWVEKYATKTDLNDTTIVQVDPSNDTILTAYELHDAKGNKKGVTINIPKDQYIKDVKISTLDATLDEEGMIVDGTGTTALCISYILADGTFKLVPIDYQKFLEEAEFGDGTEVKDHKVQVKIDPDSDSYLTVGPNGVKLSGVTDNFNNYLPLTGGILTGSLTVFNNVTANGYSIPDKSSTDLLNAVGGTTSVEDLRTEIGKDYLPLSGGTLTGDLFMGGNYIELTDSYSTTLIGSTDGVAVTDSSGNHSNLYSNRLLFRKLDDLSSVYTEYNATGVTILNKTTSDLLNAGGSTTSILDITTQVQAAIVDSAPETLDTLNELAAALGDDPNFATTITTQLGSKVDKSSLPEGILTSIDDPQYATDYVALTHSFVPVNSGVIGTEQQDTQRHINAATSTTAGVMSANDKTFLDLIYNSNLIGPDGDFILNVDQTSDEVSVAISQPGWQLYNGAWSSGISNSFVGNIAIFAATSTMAGVMSAADKTKLDTMQQQLTTKSTITWIELD